eukprot:g14595.t1
MRVLIDIHPPARSVHVPHIALRDRLVETEADMIAVIDKIETSYRCFRENLCVNGDQFDKLADQLLGFPIHSLKMLRTLVQVVFNRALDEPTFGDMYADLCVRLHERSTSWCFVKSIYNEDANRWAWTAEVGVEREVLGPFKSIMECMAKAREEGVDLEPIPPPYEMELVEMKIKDKKVVKIMQGKEISQMGQFYMVFMDEDVGRKEYQIPEEVFSSEEDALRDATKQVNIRSQLLSFCQAEFEKEDIYEDLKRREEKTDFSQMSKQEAEVLKAAFKDKRYVMKQRMLGNVQFIGELYKRSMLLENVMKMCVEHLLNATKELNRNRTLRGLKFISGDMNEDNLEALGKLIRTIGSKLDSPNNRTYMKELFRLMDKIANNKTINSRIRFIIRDLEELRRHKWRPRRNQDKAKTLDDIRKETEAKTRGGGAPPGRGGSSPGGDFRRGQGGPPNVQAARRAEQQGGGGTGPTDGFRREDDSRQDPGFSQQRDRDSRGGPTSSTHPGQQQAVLAIPGTQKSPVLPPQPVTTILGSTLNGLHRAARDGSIESTSVLLASGNFDIDSATSRGDTPLMFAAGFGHSQIARMLVNHGAKTSAVNVDGFDALHLTAERGHLDVTKLLVEAGSGLEAKTSAHGFTPLDLAAEQGHSEIMKVLIEAGADPNSSALDGTTALYRAAMRALVDTVKMLLSAGANPSLAYRYPSGAAFVPLDVAAQNGHSEVVRDLIQEHGTEGCGGTSGGVRALEGAAENQHVETMGVLTCAGVVDTGIALLAAARWGRESSVKFLLQQQEGVGYLETCDPGYRHSCQRDLATADINDADIVAKGWKAKGGLGCSVPVFEEA